MREPRWISPAKQVRALKNLLYSTTKAELWIRLFYGLEDDGLFEINRFLTTVVFNTNIAIKKIEAQRI